jgi:hypothetical protein
MGACPNPDKSMIYAYLSILPYLIPFLYFFRAAIQRNLNHFKVCAMLVSGYLAGDKFCKPFFKSTLLITEARVP